MSIIADYPANCITNTHILHDFAEIAYIVCTHAIPASTESVIEASSPDRVLDRLRNAEKQFRQQSILAALDADKLELYTFYRKVDVVKDQRTILHKFGLVCRLNSCIISSKGAARVLELLKPDSNRIYRLFTTAVLSSVQVVSKSSESAFRIGTRTYLLPSAGEDDLQPGKSLFFCPEWQLHRVNFQVTLTGQLVLTIQEARSAALNQCSDLQDHGGLGSPEPGSLLYLRPTGQIARLTDNFATTRNDLLEAVNSLTVDSVARNEAKIALLQISNTLNWFKQRIPTFETEYSENSVWIKIEIAVVEAKSELHPPRGDNQFIWKSLLWPANMVYVFKNVGSLELSSSHKATDTDPLKFALDWYNDSADRNSQLAAAQGTRNVKDDAEDDHNFGDEINFDDQYSNHNFGPPIFPASQMVYPTPPEAVMTHQTPGVSSVDGLAPTPVPASHSYQPELERFLDQEMVDVKADQPDRVGTGFYGEDLFEEMPDDKFESHVDGDEPNWDFFDQPGFHPSQDSKGKRDDEHIISNSDSDNRNSVHDEGATKDDEFPELEILTNGKNGAGVITGFSSPDISPTKIDSVYASDLSFSPSDMQSIIQHVGTISQHPRDSVIESKSGQSQSKSPIPTSNLTRRRSSVFEGVPLSYERRDHDFRYGKDGKFWFNVKPTTDIGPSPRLLSKHKQRPSSSGSDMSMTSSTSDVESNSSNLGNGKPLQKRIWTEYHVDDSEERIYTDDIDLQQIDSDMQSLLAIVGSASGEDPFLVSIEPLKASQRLQNYSTQKPLMVAQMLVDQVSQATLLRDEAGLQLHHRCKHLQVDVSMDHNGARAEINHATLGDLASIPPRTSSKLASLSSRLLCLNRADSGIMARQSILPFWDLLGLQPYNEPKNITVFCMHPRGSNVADGSAAFLSRLADTYSSCNLGTHTTGKLAGLTNTGILSWTSQTPPGPNLKQLCQRFGSSIATNISGVGSTVVVYMVSPSREVSAYREMCSAFMILFNSFIDTSEGIRNTLELVLQIVPLDFVAASDTLVVPNQRTYLDLALEVYNRVPVQYGSGPLASCASASILEKHQLREPLFELSNTIVSPLGKEGPCLHLAYSYSLDKRWLTAAWSDERGLTALTMSYCLNMSNETKSRAKSEVLRSLWEISHDIMGGSRNKWRLVIAHVGFFDMEDTNEWQQLMSQSTDDRKLMHRLLLLSIDLNPDIFVTLANPGIKGAPQHANAQTGNVSGTPGSTPQPHITSPDQIVAATPASGSLSNANAATPPDQNFESGPDLDTSLVDPTEQCWAALLGFGINQSTNPLEIRPAVASGLLIKRTGLKDDSRSLRFLGMNLVAVLRLQPTSLSLSERDGILSEIMDQYRGLVTLAVSRGCIDKALDCVPWHVATVVKGSRVLGEAM